MRNNASGFTGAPALRSTSDSRSSPPRTWVADPPPFGVAQDRFQQPARTGSPDYHVAYRDVQQPPRWNAKGWVGMDDYIKPRRGTAPSVYGSPGLIPPSAPPRHAAGLAPLAAPHPNEVRLQELLNLQRRKLETDPGPGAYEPRDINHRRRFRRQANPDTDGPFFLDEMPDGTSTRVKEIAETLRQRADSGLGPGEYDGAMNKDVLMKSTPAPKLGTSARSGKTDHAKSLSISRSIQHGIDWHVPVIVQPIVVPPIGSTSASGAGGGGGGGGGGGTSASGGAEPSTSGRPLTADRSNALYGGTSSAGGTSRDTSPTGRGGTADQYLGVPPPPPAHVSRGVKKQQQRRPGDWDWNRLPKNYRNSWTTLHGGAYTHGEHPLPRPGSREAAMAAAAGMLGSGPAAPGSGHPPYPYPYQAMDVGPSGIYPIQEESSSALERDESSSYGAGYPHGTQPHSVQSVTSANAAAAGLTAQLKQVAYWGGEGPDGGGGGGEGQGGGGGGANQSQGPGLPSGLVPSPKLRALVSDEDVRRRRAAAAFAARAQLQANRVGDWQSKFAG
ncbi:hypothetical protein HYH03_013443 [Edaphochlamys debaryana]|uniref:Uncharacterized protein n=1 Tax=Edaphochlamys debaryana TaxID=47281 RepID=A0A836BSZ0_9CHLO|nr:hypothetical protein HYH03_013443 [Edaphochlamys debaryana]|eukprot:KAG2488006.1 hypothetical protein HYH03_013443 [Edaphochlamys debaryana]